MDRGPRNGITGVVFASDLDICLAVGRRAWAVVRGSRTLVDGLIEAWVVSSFGVIRVIRASGLIAEAGAIVLLAVAAYVMCLKDQLSLEKQKLREPEKFNHRTSQLFSVSST